MQFPFTRTSHILSPYLAFPFFPISYLSPVFLHFSLSLSLWYSYLHTLVLGLLTNMPFSSTRTSHILSILSCLAIPFFPVSYFPRLSYLSVSLCLSLSLLKLLLAHTRSRNWQTCNFLSLALLVFSQYSLVWLSFMSYFIPTPIFIFCSSLFLLIFFSLSCPPSGFIYYRHDDIHM